MSTRTPRVVKLPAGHLADVAREIGERERRIDELQRKIDTAPAAELIARGDAWLGAIRDLQATLPALYDRQARLEAGIADPPTPSRKAATKAAVPSVVLPKAWPPAPVKLGDGPEIEADDHQRLAAADEAIRAVVASYGRNAMAGLYQGIVLAFGHAATAADVLAEEVRALRQRVAELEDRISEAPLKWCGSYQRALEYGPGAVVTRGGSMWVALRSVPPNNLPGESNPEFWQLAVKHGRDGKDAPHA
ncbi:hypothetical protein [Phenylobacterium kunshanense]|uniref:hypothetical protein n=1 Tax=Phenylobacterium kunshanense TaxID=1445034 RepID=UPI0014020028|nr:hypothetical protein [Phenylobacterium kunshanense]